MAMIRKITEIPLELFKKKIPPSLPLLKGGVVIPPLTKGDEGGFLIFIGLG
jgi:hypothetical protein